MVIHYSVAPILQKIQRNENTINQFFVCSALKINILNVLFLLKYSYLQKAAILCEPLKQAHGAWIQAIK
jgi:hypothetical protein